MDYLKNIALNIYGIEGIFITAFIAIIALLFWMKSKIIKKEGWDLLSVGIFIFITILFFGIYLSYEKEYKQYKAKQKLQWEEKTKNWTKEDWKNYEAQREDQDYQPGAYGPE